MEFTTEQLNYYRICYISTDILTEGLREIFKQEWNNRYGETMGEWKDEPRNGEDFWKGESPRNQEKNAHLIATMIKGNRVEWDSTMLFYAILYSDCIHDLSPVVRSNIDDLRKFRNEEFAHMSEGNLSDLQFQTVISKVHTAFQALGLSTLKIQEIKNQTSFPTAELTDVLKKVDNLKQELQKQGKDLQEQGKELQEKEEQRQVLEDQLNSNIFPFCVLPPNPSHEVVGRDNEVAKITQHLKELKRANESKLSYLYISGNPGSGKSQLARLVAKRFFNEVKDLPRATSFVMTLNAESPDTLLKSYAAFSRQLKCPEYVVTNTLNSRDLTTDEKITNLKTLIGTKMELYASWLLVVDNVTSISRVHGNLSEPGNEQWARGQLLITTKDTASIPLSSSFIQHISINKGMEPRDASCLLAKLSGITDSQMEEDVAQALDYQPLALASAATYVREVRQRSKFGWNDFLKKLEKGQRNTTETVLAEINQSYTKSMTIATTLAIDILMKSDKVIHHTFSFLSVCAPQPLRLDVVINYVILNEETEDREAIAVSLQRCSLLLIEEGESGVYIRVHRIVRDALSTVAEKCIAEDENLTVFEGVMRAFNQFIGYSPGYKCIDDIVPHLETVIKTAGNPSWLSQIGKNVSLNIPHDLVTKLGKICQSRDKLWSAKKYYQLALELIKSTDELDAAKTKSLIAHVSVNLGELNEASSCYESALSTLLKVLGPQHTEVATAYDCLGSVYHKMSDLQRAKEYHEQALDIRLKKLGPEHVDVATSYNNLGLVFRAMRDLKQAKEYHERALEIRLTRLGPDHVCVATSYNDLGLLLCKLGDLQQSKEYYHRAISIYHSKLGLKHIYLATANSNLGSVYVKMGDLQKAKEHYERAHEGFLKSWGPKHINVAISWNALARVNCELGDFQKAKSLYEWSLAIQNSVVPEDTNVANTYDSLGFVHREMGEFQKAKEYYEKSLAIRCRKLGSGHADVATIHNSLGLVLHNLGDLQKAQMHYEHALQIYRETLDEEHPNIASLYNNMGVLSRTTGGLEKSKKFHEQALAIRLKRLGADNVHVAMSYNDLGLVHCELGELGQAKVNYERALTIFREKLGPDHLYVAHVSSNLGLLHSKLGEWKQANGKYESALNSYRKTLGPKHDFVASSCSDLSLVNQKLGRFHLAKNYCEQALAIWQMKNQYPGDEACA